MQTEAKKRPLTPDEVAALDNVSPSEPIPKDIAELFANRRITLSPRGSEFDPKRCLVQIAGEQAAWNIEVPENAVLGLMGSSAERLDPTSQPERPVGEGRIKAFRPPWASHVFHPKSTTAGSAPRIRSFAGRRVTPHYVWGNDDREVFIPDGYPLQCVGKVFVHNIVQTNRSVFDRVERGTGVLIGSRHVLTAGHLFPWGSSNWFAEFVPAYFDGTSFAGPGARSSVTDVRGWDSQDVAWDSAVMRLSEPLGDFLGFFGATEYDGDWDGEPWWGLVGYPGEVAGGERPSRQINFPVLDNDSDGAALELEHHFDTSPGDSGGPLFGTFDDTFGTIEPGPYVIGSEVGDEIVPGGFLGIRAEVNGVAAGGRAMVNLVAWARNNWP